MANKHGSEAMGGVGSFTGCPPAWAPPSHRPSEGVWAWPSIHSSDPRHVLNASTEVCGSAPPYTPSACQAPALPWFLLPQLPPQRHCPAPYPHPVVGHRSRLQWATLHSFCGAPGRPSQPTAPGGPSILAPGPSLLALAPREAWAFLIGNPDMPAASAWPRPSEAALHEAPSQEDEDWQAAGPCPQLHSRSPGSEVQKTQISFGVWPELAAHRL